MNEHQIDARKDNAGRKAKRPHVVGIARCDETILRLGGHGDNWHASWAADGSQLLSLNDGVGGWFSKPGEVFYNSRIIVANGDPRKLQISDLPSFPYLRPYGPARYYGLGILAVDGVIYHYLSTFSGGPYDPKPGQLRFWAVKLIYSPDGGRSWCNQDGSTPVVWEDWEGQREGLIFYDEPRETFSMPTVLQMGRDYADNRDGYVYLYSPNGSTEGTMNELVLARVDKSRVLERTAYQYFAGLGSDGAPCWIDDIAARQPVHHFPPGWVARHEHPWSWVPSVVYNRALDIYMMASWGTNSPDGNWFSRPSYLGLWVADTPWGPWRQIHEEMAWTPGGDIDARCYSPTIAPGWIAPDGRSFWLVWSDFQRTEEYIPPIPKPEDPGYFEFMRRTMPYYGFNVQRVDVIIEA